MTESYITNCIDLSRFRYYDVFNFSFIVFSQYCLTHGITRNIIFDFSGQYSINTEDIIIYFKLVFQMRFFTKKLTRFHLFLSLPHRQMNFRYLTLHRHSPFHWLYPMFLHQKVSSKAVIKNLTRIFLTYIFLMVIWLVNLVD